ncbi:hypothetical protein [Leptodesmis sp.]
MARDRQEQVIPTGAKRADTAASKAQRLAEGLGAMEIDSDEV